MNILFVYYKGLIPNAGGVAKITTSLVGLFRENGYHVWLLGVADPKEGEYDSSQRFFPHPEDHKDNYVFFNGLCHECRFDVIITQIPFLHTWVYDILERCKPQYGYKVISCLHNPVMSQAKNLYFRKGYILRNHRWILNLLKGGPVLKVLIQYYKCKYKRGYANMLVHSDKVVALCPGMYDELLEMIDVRETGKVVVIPNFIDDKSIADKGVDKKESLIVWCGAVNFDVKRVDIALKVWKQLSKSLPDWKLCILGDGPGLAAAKQLAESLELANCSFEGRVDPVPYYRRATFSLVTSSYESFSLVTLESLAHGVIPVVFDTFPAAKMLIDNSRTGFLIPPYDIDSCEAVIAGCASNQARLKEMSERAREAARVYSKDNVFRLWRAALES